MRWLAFPALAGLAACAAGPVGPARGFDHPAVQALMAKPVPEYFAEVQLSAQVAQACPRYRFDDTLNAQMTARRNAAGSGETAALSQRDAIEAMGDIRLREFRARYGTVPGQGDVCAAADAETARGSALSALLVPLAGA